MEPEPTACTLLPVKHRTIVLLPPTRLVGQGEVDRPSHPLPLDFVATKCRVFVYAHNPCGSAEIEFELDGSPFGGCPLRDEFAVTAPGEFVRMLPDERLFRTASLRVSVAGAVDTTLSVMLEGDEP